MRYLTIHEDVKNSFEVHIGLAELRGVEQEKKGIEDKIEKIVRGIEEGSRRKYTLEGLKDVEGIRRQRDFFWRMGIDPTKNRPAAEALLRRILSGKIFPRILPVVDAYNLASVRTLLILSAFDDRNVKERLQVRFAGKGEKVVLIGGRIKALTGKELVLTDEEKILCVYAYSDAEATKVVAKTEDVLLVAYGYPGLEKEELRNGLTTAVSLILEICGGNLIWNELI